MKIKKLLKTLLIILLCFVLSVVVQNISMLWHIASIWSIEYILHALTYIGIWPMVILALLIIANSIFMVYKTVDVKKRK